MGGVVHLVGVRLLQLDCKVQNTQPVDGPLAVAAEFGVAWSLLESVVAYACKVEVNVVASAHDNHPVFTCTAVYEVRYRVPVDSDFDEREVIAFGMTSAAMAAWPYLREEVQSASLRCGIHQPIVLDVLRQPAPTQPPNGDGESLG